MAIILSTSSQTITSERSIDNFTITIPPNANPYVTVTYNELKKDGNGAIISNNPSGVLVFHKNYLTGVLPGYGLPDFLTIYAGLRDMLHSGWYYQQTGGVI